MHLSSSIEYGHVFKPKRVMVDFEQAMMSAITENLPETELKGCYFHFQQALYRNLKSRELTHYSDKPDSWTRKLFKKLGGLAFVPIEKLDMAYELIWNDDEVVNNIDNYPLLKEKILEYKSYFEKQWFNNNTARVNRIMWNHYENQGRRTQNNLEGMIV